ncbi:hypothetical protein BV20DRAFT_974019 [Pilatotrama ljubarskyi]|nr:hypothetical protein BV20DRAFT_974019 [Pilatotrama ljubarskyi]
MDSCPLPQLCLRIIAAVAFPLKLTSPLHIGREHGQIQRALCACAMTYRAWRPRAQFLWKHVRLVSQQSISRFIAAIRRSASTDANGSSSVSALVLVASPTPYGSVSYADRMSLSQADALFMHSTLRPSAIQAYMADFSLSPKIVRMRLPAFTSVTQLVLFRCRFETIRAWCGLAGTSRCCPSGAASFPSCPSQREKLRSSWACVYDSRSARSSLH